MLAPFFVLAAQSPSRQRSFRRGVAAHLLLLAAVARLLWQGGSPGNTALAGHLLLAGGIIEGATLLGWRLTQLPKSQALEFLLVSPLRAVWVFLAEALVGLALLGLVTLSGLPVLLLLVEEGRLQPVDLIPLLLLPVAWGAVTGLGLTVWASEPVQVRRWGERVMAAVVVLYLLVGVLAGEHLRQWLGFLPARWSAPLLEAFGLLHTHNPFGVMQCWMEHGPAASWERLAGIEGLALLTGAGLLARGAARLQRHFHELHYQPARSVRGEARPAVGDHPLSWWAVKRVGRFSGRINLWLAGGFCLLYALYILAGPAWPAWLGRLVFLMCDASVGPAGLAAGLVVLAAVPAAFQYGLWDSSPQDRCRRLELLLLTDLRPGDYWRAAARAAWRRGRGYLAIAGLLWGAALLAGRLSLPQACVAGACSLLLWALYFTLGFRAFAHGLQAGGLGVLLTVGLPLGTWLLTRANVPVAANLLPPGMVYSAVLPAPTLFWLAGPLLCGCITLVLARRTLADCDSELRRWYDTHAGSKVLT